MSLAIFMISALLS